MRHLVALAISAMIFSMIAGAVGENDLLTDIHKLYLCQTEHILNEIFRWESEDPERYKDAVKNGEISPLDAARKMAAADVAHDLIRCNDENNLELDENVKKDSPKIKIKVPTLQELKIYCPRTIEIYGHPCR